MPRKTSSCVARHAIAAAGTLAFTVAAVVGSAAEPASSVSDADPSLYRVVEVARGLNFPWSMAFVPGGDILISERNGGLRIVRGGRLDPKPLEGTPRAYVDGQGGLLGLAVHPQFDRNQHIYLCRSAGTAAANASTVVRARLEGNRLADVTKIFAARPEKRKGFHFGCRLLFAPDGKLFVTLGDGFDYKERAQTLDNDFGKIVRLNDDGSIPQDNPFVGRDGALAEIFSYGHRNVQGIALRPGTQEIWAHEHGPRGGDEVNVLEAGANYGWPAITYGIDYSGAIISDKTALPGMEQPVVYWVPSIAPSGMAFYDGDRFPEWRGDLFVGALVGAHLRRVDIENGRVVGQQRLLSELKKRIRDVRSGPDGYLYLLTDERNGKLLRLEPPARGKS